MTAPPTIGIVTICFNSAQTIEKTLRSVAAQVEPPEEFIVVDGGSTDGTRTLIERYQHVITKWRSEPDAGIANAMNKAIAMATADYLLFVHADDELAGPHVLAVVRAMIERDDADLIAFPILFGSPGSYERRTSTGIGWYLNFKTTFRHQGVFMRRSLFTELGAYDESYRIEMDYEFFLRCMRRGRTCRRIENPIVTIMSDGGISSRLDWPSVQTRLVEEKATHDKHLAGALGRWIYRAWWALYPRYKRRALERSTRSQSTRATTPGLPT